MSDHRLSDFFPGVKATTEDDPDVVGVVSYTDETEGRVYVRFPVNGELTHPDSMRAVDPLDLVVVERPEPVHPDEARVTREPDAEPEAQ